MASWLGAFFFNAIVLLMVVLMSATKVHANHGAAHSTSKKFKGTAYELTSGKMVYVEWHEIFYDDNLNPVERLVHYYDVDGNLMVTKRSISGDSNWAPAFRLDDVRRGRTEEVRYVNNQLEVNYREAGDHARVSFPVSKLPDNLVIDAGFDGFIKDHFERLLKGKTTVFHFLSVSRLDTVSMRLRPRKKADQKIYLIMELDNPFLRMLVDPIEIVYSIVEPTLIEYKGLSNISKNEKKNYEVRIEYDYSAQY